MRRDDQAAQSGKVGHFSEMQNTTHCRAATQQKVSPADRTHDRNRLSLHWTPNSNDTTLSTSSLPAQAFPIPPEMNFFPGTPLSQIRGFPDAVSPNLVSNPSEIARQPSPLLMPQPFQPPEVLSGGGDGFSGPESLALPQVSPKRESQKKKGLAGWSGT